MPSHSKIAKVITEGRSRSGRKRDLKPRVVKSVVLTCGHTRTCETRGFKLPRDKAGCPICTAKRPVFAPNRYENLIRRLVTADEAERELVAGHYPLECHVCSRPVTRPVVRELCGHLSCDTCRTAVCTKQGCRVSGFRFTPLLQLHEGLTAGCGALKKPECEASPTCPPMILDMGSSRYAIPAYTRELKKAVDVLLVLVTSILKTTILGERLRIFERRHGEMWIPGFERRVRVPLPLLDALSGALAGPRDTVYVFLLELCARLVKTYHDVLLRETTFQKSCNFRTLGDVKRYINLFDLPSYHCMFIDKTPEMDRLEIYITELLQP